jgi:predicted PurR-regulated permease PerM
MSDDSPPPDSRRARLWKASESRGIPLRTILVVVAVVAVAWLLGKLLYRLRDVLLLIVVAGFIALILNPLVVVLQRWRIRRRGWAVAMVTLWGLLVFFGLAAAFGYPLVGAITHLANELPSYVSKAEHGTGWIGHLVRKYHVQHWVQSNEPKLVDFGKGLAAPALSVGEGAFSLVLALFTIFVLTVLLLLEGPKMRSGILGMMSPGRAERYSEVAREVNRSVAGYMLGNFLTSLIAGVVVFVTLLVVGVPFPFLWALWVALVDFLPMIGGALAGIPTVLFALGHSLTAGIVTLVVFLIYTQIENHVLNPVVMSRTVRVNPLLVLLSILVGAEIGSWIGGIFGAFVAALLAIPAAGAIQVLVRELWRSFPQAPASPPAQTNPRAPAGLPAPANPQAQANPPVQASSPPPPVSPPPLGGEPAKLGRRRAQRRREQQVMAGPPVRHPPHPHPEPGPALQVGHRVQGGASLPVGDVAGLDLVLADRAAEQHLER